MTTPCPLTFPARPAARRRRRPAFHAAVVLVTAAAALSACNDAPAPTPKATGPVRVDMPEYWATTENAESRTNLPFGAQPGIVYDDDTAIYNSIDVLRGVDLASGKAKWDYRPPKPAQICSLQPSRRVAEDTVVLTLAAKGLDSYNRPCNTIVGVDTSTGKKRWQINGPNITLSRVGTSFTALSRNLDATYVIGAPTATGKLWFKQVEKLLPSDTKGELADLCEGWAGGAAQAPVTIAVVACESSTESPVTVFGFDEATGRKLWSKPWWGPADPHTLSMIDSSLEYSPVDGTQWQDVKTRGGAAPAVRVDPKDGTVVEQPVVHRDDRFEDLTREMASDLQSVGFHEGEVFYGKDIRLQATAAKGDGVTPKIDLTAVDTVTGKQLWARGDTKGKAFLALGFTPDAAEFWYAVDNHEVVRVDARSGREVARGSLGKPEDAVLDIGVSSVTIGDEYVLVRRTPLEGTDITAGVTAYRWRVAPKK